MTGLLLDHLWQSTLFAAIAGLLTLVFHKNRASIRYGLWFAASIKFLAPFALLTALGNALYHPVIAAPQSLAGMRPVMRPFSGGVLIMAHSQFDWTLMVLALWILGTAAILSVWLARSWRLGVLVHQARPLRWDAPMPVKLSGASLEPGLVGIWRPVLLLPEGIFEKLTPAEMRAVLAHEVCHLHRRDNLMATLHMMVEALFWFHPLVWWLGARLVAERENACDESVIENGNSPQTYAEGILKVCRLYVHSPLACAAGISGADLKKRMEAIMANHLSLRLNAGRKLLLAGAVSVAVAAPLAIGMLNAPPVYAQGAPAAPHPGTQAALRRQIEGWERKQPVTAEMDAGLVQATKEQGADIQKMIDGWGALKSIAFKENEDGNDAYLVKFEHGLSAWTIGPLQAGKISSLFFSPAIKRQGNQPSPGAETALRRDLDSLWRGKPDYSLMVPETAKAAKPQEPTILADAKNLGPVRSIAFKAISVRGWDVYAVTYANGIATWNVEPLVGGKLRGIYSRDIRLPQAPQHPGTEAFLRRYIEAIQNEKPNYAEMLPGLARAVGEQLPGLQASFHSLGALRSVAFQGGGINVTDTYVVTFQHGRTQWSVGALNANGKEDILFYRNLN